MEDSEPVNTASSTPMDYTASGFNPATYVEGDSTASATQGAVATSVVQDSNTTDEQYFSLESSATVSHGDASYGAFQNGNVDGMSAENGSASHGGGATAEVQLQESSVPSSAEEERLWNIVRANSLDFDAWVALVEETEKVAEGNILKIRQVYDSFLAEFPLCYGYWKKYADHEALGSTESAMGVYERAVQAVACSVDIWLHYCRFAISKYEDPDIIRSLFERGVAYVGTDYLSYTFWDEYIEYEYKNQEWRRIASIYTRILENPILYLDKYYNSFKELAASRPVSELRTTEEVASVGNVVSDSTSNVTEGEVALDLSTKPVSAGLSEAEELEKYIAIREEMYKKAKEFDSKIIGFETAIARPYFHVKPLNSAELENWHSYLNFIENEDDFSKVFKLYERCLIPCANYSEYWIRYVKCMEAHQRMDLAENALVRASKVFVKKRPEIHLFSAWFKEQNADIEGARAAYQLVHAEISPGLLEAIIKHANMERRVGNLDDALSVYEHAIAIEKGKEHSQTLAVLFAQYARFLYLTPGKLEKARDLLVEAPEHVQLSKPFLEALICLETVMAMPKRIEYIDTLVGKFIDPNSDIPIISSLSDREDLSSVYLEFLDLVGDATAIKKALERHLKVFLNNRSSTMSRKRHADDLSSDRAKLARSSDPAAQAMMGAYPPTAAQNQWTAASYGGVQPQAWPQAAQPPAAQPWYPQQTATAPYAAYGAAYPQASAAAPPAPAPPTAAYGAYPATYPPQVYPQQTYAQPTAAAVPTPPQATAAPQAYYGSYY